MDDIEIALNKKYQIDLQLASNQELKNNDDYFKKYLKEKLHLKINDFPREYNYIGKEYDGDLVYFYLEVENIDEHNESRSREYHINNLFSKARKLTQNKNL